MALERVKGTIVPVDKPSLGGFAWHSVVKEDVEATGIVDVANCAQEGRSKLRRNGSSHTF